MYLRDVHAGGRSRQNAQRVVSRSLARRLLRSNHAEHVVFAGKHVASVDRQHTASVWQAARTGAETAGEERLVDNRGVGYARRQDLAVSIGDEILNRDLHVTVWYLHVHACTVHTRSVSCPVHPVPSRRSSGRDGTTTLTGQHGTGQRGCLACCVSDLASRQAHCSQRRCTAISAVAFWS